MSDLIDNAKREFQRHKKLADQAIAQLGDDDFFRRPSGDVNSVALIVKHLSGNLYSRWTDFLTADGDKPERDRDSEFRIEPQDSRENLLSAWMAGWQAVFETLDTLAGSDLNQLVNIRGEAHTVSQAVLRGLTHAAYHTGQIMFITRLLRPDAAWATIAPGQTRNAVPYLTPANNHPLLRGRRVLVVDHDESVRISAHKLLEPYGCFVETASNAGEAIFLVRNASPVSYDVILAEIRLPDMSGYQLSMSLQEIIEPKKES